MVVPVKWAAVLLKAEGSYTGDVVIGADALRQQPVSDLPGKDGRTLSLVLGNLSNHLWGGHPGFTPSNGPGTDGSGLIVSAQDLTHTAIGHLQAHEVMKHQLETIFVCEREAWHQAKAHIRMHGVTFIVFFQSCVPPLIRVSILFFSVTWILQFITKTLLKTLVWDFYVWRTEEGSRDEELAGQSSSWTKESVTAGSTCYLIHYNQSLCRSMEKWHQLTRKHLENLLILWRRKSRRIMIIRVYDGWIKNDEEGGTDSWI